ncbi:hypothetical protein ES703_86765 [subsurface metagenome]
MFRTAYIAWLQLESLCRQRGVTFQWELIVAEELGDETFGEAQVNRYQKRLQEVGCTRIDYTPLETWITLGAKWKLLIERSSPSSILFFLQGADSYSAPQRLHTLYTLYNDHPTGDWFIPFTGIDYDLSSGKALYRDPANLKILNKADIHGNAASSSLLRDAAMLFKTETMVSLVDGKIWAYCKSVRPQGMKVIRDSTDMWKYGFSLNGFGNISDPATIFSPQFRSLFIPYPYNLADTIPKDILDRLSSCIQFLPLHTRKVPPY